VLAALSIGTLIFLYAVNHKSMVTIYALFGFLFAGAEDLFLNEITWITEKSGRKRLVTYLRCMPIDWKLFYRIKIRMLGKYYIRMYIGVMVAVIISCVSFTRTLKMDVLYHFVVLFVVMAIFFGINILMMKREEHLF
jgi:hypothetical protein